METNKVIIKTVGKKRLVWVSNIFISNNYKHKNSVSLVRINIIILSQLFKILSIPAKDRVS
mgnify:CR=1 FL=1